MDEIYIVQTKLPFSFFFFVESWSFSFSFSFSFVLEGGLMGLFL